VVLSWRSCGGLVVLEPVTGTFVPGESRGFDPQGDSGGFAFRNLAGEDHGEVFLVGPARVSCLVAEPAESVADAWRAKRPGVILDLRSGAGRCDLNAWNFRRRTNALAT
jgi:hypothetical protein